MKLQFPRWLMLLSLVLLGGTLDQAMQITQYLTPLLGMLVTIIVLIALPILVFHVLIKEVLSKI